MPRKAYHRRYSCQSSDFQQVAQRQPDAPALVTLDGAVVHATVLGLADRMAGGLLAAKVRTGDRAAVHLTNRYELVAVYYACLRVGAVIVPVSHKMSAGKVEQLITDSAPRFYFGEAAVHGPCSDVTEKSAAVERAWILDASATTATTRPWNDVLADAPAATDEVDADDLAAIFYTSGTTGRPRAWCSPTRRSTPASV